ncbi:MAG TPA: energy transducer TonB [Chitinophagaceae bacterium]|nr:energy transducer TonB [Chitinophagaceae bacterium]
MKEGSTYHYSAEDIQRYISGKMSAGEMHAIEKAALEDPFLADAIEGIREMQPNLNTDLMELKNKMSEKTEQRSVKVSWLAILAAAAIIISLSFGGWLFFRDSDTPQIAKLEETAPTPSTAETVQDTAASTAPADAPAGQTVPAEEPLSTKKSSPAPAKNEAESAPAKEEKPVAAAKAPTTAPPPALTKSEPTTAKKTIAAASKTESGKQLTVSSKDAAAPQAQSGPDLVLEMAKNVEPANGWSAFAKYVAANMQRPTGESAGLHGKVPMSFVVDPDGSISNIKVEKSLHPDYDKEAVRLLTNGPKWKASNADKPVRAVYTIVF